MEISGLAREIRLGLAGRPQYLRITFKCNTSKYCQLETVYCLKDWVGGRHTLLGSRITEALGCWISIDCLVFALPAETCWPIIYSGHTIDFTIRS